MTLTSEPVLTLVLVCIMPFLAVIIFFISKKGVVLYTETQSAADKLVRKIQENMAGVRIIKALSKTEYETEKFDEINSEVVKRDQRAGRLMAATSPIMHLLLNIGLTLLHFSVPKCRVFSANYWFLSYFTIILTALMMVTRLCYVFKGVASARRICEVFDSPKK